MLWLRHHPSEFWPGERDEENSVGSKNAENECSAIKTIRKSMIRNR